MEISDIFEFVEKEMRDIGYKMSLSYSETDEDESWIVYFVRDKTYERSSGMYQ